MTLRFWPLVQKEARIVGYPDAAFRNNEDKTSQRGQCIFICAKRVYQPNVRGSLVDYESTKIKRTILSTTVAELYSLMKCYGTCLFLRGLWMDITGCEAELHIRTDANNLVTTASTTHLPEQKETIHMINQLRTEACSGQMEDLAHVVTTDCLSDALTKNSIKPDTLMASRARLDLRLPNMCRRDAAMWVHSSVVRAADCRSAGPWFKSGCALFVHWHARRCMRREEILEAGLEPAISSLGGRRLIHSATRALKTSLCFG